MGYRADQSNPKSIIHMYIYIKRERERETERERESEQTYNIIDYMI